MGYAVRMLQVIPSGSAAIVERFGLYSRTLHPGLHTITPFVDTIRNRIDLREQTVPFPLRIVSMYDGTDLPVEFTIQYSVTDPVKATYGTASYIHALERHAAYELTYALANLAAADARLSLQQIAESVRCVLAPRAQRWGLTLHEFLLTLGEVKTSDVEDEARVAAQHGGASAQFYAPHMTMNVLPNGQIAHQKPYLNRTRSLDFCWSGMVSLGVREACGVLCPLHDRGVRGGVGAGNAGGAGGGCPRAGGGSAGGSRAVG
ncbi:SPFH domain-containing protein [Streptomyces sp. HC307]|uniref:SPFH domain-containing protein n=1 Tax=Streptomyces flavusporus TaxID=3385496 RepID=UPI003916E3B3